MDLDRYKSDDLQRVQKESDNLHNNIMALLRIKYVVLFTFFGYGLSNSLPLVTIPMFFTLIPIYMVANACDKNICRNAAYIIVFYGREIAPEWEIRLRKYHNYQKNVKRNFKDKFKMSRFSVISYGIESGMGILVFWITRLKYIENHPELNGTLIYEILKCDMSVVILLLIYLFLLVFVYTTKVNYFKEENNCIKKWEKIKAEEKLKIRQDLLSKFADDSSMQSLVKNIIVQNSNLNDRSLELLNKSLQISMKNTVLNRLLELNPDYKDPDEDKKSTALLDILKKL